MMDHGRPADPLRPLDGVRVLDFSRHMSGPYGTSILSDYGADIIKVESTPVGDPSRATGTAFLGDESALFLMWNRGKRSLAVDLRSDRGRAAVLRLVEGADVVVENYRPGVADAIGIGYDALSTRNPRIIHCSVSAFGATGPLAPYPGTDPVVQAMSGVMSLTGEEDGGPVLVGAPIADFTGALLLVQGVLLALLARERTGEGQHVEVSMLAGLASSLTTRLASYWATGEEPRRNGSAHSVVAPYEAFETADGFAVAGAWAPDAWPRFCAAIERVDLVDDPRFATNADRVRNRSELNDILRPLFLSRSTADWERRFHDANALFGEVCTIGTLLAHPQAQGMVGEVQHATLGALPQLEPPVALSGTPGRLGRAAPVLGEHSIEILAEAGLDQDEVDSMVGSSVVIDGRTTTGSHP